MRLLNNASNELNFRLMSNRFMLDLPKDWIDRSVYRFDGPMEDGIQHHIMVNIEHGVPIKDLEKYAALQIKAVETTLQGYREIKRGPIALAKQMPAYELVYKWCPVQERETYQRMIWVLCNGSGYSMSATFSKKTWKMMTDHVDRIMRSFTILVPPKC